MSVFGVRRKEEPGDAGRAEGAGRLFVLQEPRLPGGTLLALSWVPLRGWEALSPRGQGQLLRGPVLGPAATARKPRAPVGAAGRRPVGPRTLLALPASGRPVPERGRKQSSEPSQVPAGSRPEEVARVGPRPPAARWAPSTRSCTRGGARAPSAGQAAEGAALPAPSPLPSSPAPSPPLRTRTQLPPLKPGHWGEGPDLPPPPRGAQRFQNPWNGPPRHSSPEFSPCGAQEPEGPRGRRRRKGGSAWPERTNSLLPRFPLRSPRCAEDSGSRQCPRAAGP